MKSSPDDPANTRSNGPNLVSGTLTLRVYVRHYNEQRPHRALALQPPDPPSVTSTRGNLAGSAVAIRRRDLLGGLIHEYEAAAA